MIPFGFHFVTLYHKTPEGYTRHMLNGCSWHSVNERELSEGATIITERTTCRIPPNHVCPAPGDLLILGDIQTEVSGDIELVRLMDSVRAQGFRAFRVQSCADNSVGVPLPHYSAVGV
jgi:hypothetical protein